MYVLPKKHAQAAGASNVQVLCIYVEIKFPEMSGIFQEMSGKFPEMSGKNPDCSGNFSGNFRNVLEMSKTCPGSFQYFFRNVPGNVQELSGNCPGNVREISGNCLGNIR